ncbi:MAG: hypothetical protein HC877_23045 [Thioploca sp.]|nr:hypothetical protein [Thioploca sp.]
MADTKGKATLGLNEWHVVDLVYDHDTLGLLIDNQVVSVTAFPIGKLNSGTGEQLFIGTWTNGSSFQFKGQIAAVEVFDGVPLSLENKLDSKRSTPEWFITNKFNKIRKNLNFGAKTGSIEFDGLIPAYVQSYQHGLIMYASGYGAAFEMHGAILALYQAQPDLKTKLGVLVSDELDAAKPGSRKSLFAKGGIYWSGNTGAVPVLEQIYLSYENFGESSHPIGLPVSTMQDVPNGKMQEFESGRIYYRDSSPTALEVHGAILSKYKETGSHLKWGFPITDEMDIKDKNGSTKGKFSQFEHCTIYWSGLTGAHVVYGSIREKYLGIGGPNGDLGFPISSEEDIPNVSGPGRYNCFQRGSILWFGNKTIVCSPYQIFIGRVNTIEEEGCCAGQNDVYMFLTIKDNGHVLYRRRLPNDGDFGGRNIVDVNHKTPSIIPNNPNSLITVELDIWDSDGFLTGDDDHLGFFKKELSISNAWGLLEREDGIFNSGRFSSVNNINWAVQPVVPTDFEKDFWGVINRGTPELTWEQYASAFEDVDSETEWWDITDGFDALFYELVVKGIASGGNCFGMSTQAIYGWKSNSIFSLPLKRFTNWGTVVNEFNVKQAYQMGAGPIWWFVGEFLLGNTHDPKEVFIKTREAFKRGDTPVMCVSQNYDFSGAPHCILPFEWDSSSKPWKVKIYDPNKMNTAQIMSINPDDNSFTYNNGTQYQGTGWSGGRLHYMPWSLLSHPQRTPVWDAIVLLLAGIILIVGDDAETIALLDNEGNDINGINDTSQIISNLRNKFVPFKGYGAKGTVKGDIFFGRDIQSPSIQLLKNMSATRSSVASIERFASGLESLIGSSLTNCFLHKIKGLRKGKLNYWMKHKLTEYHFESVISNKEQNTLEVRNLGTQENTVKLNTPIDKAFKTTFASRLGVGNDRMRVVLNNMPAKANLALTMNIQPNLGAIDILSGVEPVNVPIGIETKIDGKITRRNFQIPLDRGTRIVLSHVLSTESIKVGKIDNILGEIIEPKIIKKC